MKQEDSPIQATDPELRLFIAFVLPDRVKAALREMQDKLRRRLGGPGFRWAKDDQFHLTLVFLGNVPEKSLPGLSDGLYHACAPFGAMQLRAETVGVFPAASRPRVIWAGIHAPGNHLDDLQQAVQVIAAPHTEEPLRDRFQAHVTLARVKDFKRSDVDALKDELAAQPNKCFGEWLATEVELIRSQLSPKGSTYTTLSTAPLRGSLPK
jgi:RNA 2',3'-cyclic 3'-phosphodiesterase